METLWSIVPQQSVGLEISVYLPGNSINPINSGIYLEYSVTPYPGYSHSNLMSNSFGSSPNLIPGAKLNGDNYFFWSQSVCLALEGRHKFGYLTREIAQHVLEDARERIWKGKDSLIRSLLTNFMEPQIVQLFLYGATAKDIWDILLSNCTQRDKMLLVFTL